MIGLSKSNYVSESDSHQVNETVEKCRAVLDKVLQSAAKLSQETLDSAQCHVQDLIVSLLNRKLSSVILT
jgi:hypothetical protein